MDNITKHILCGGPLSDEKRLLEKLANANKRIKDLKRRIAELEERVKRAEATIPWTAPGMEWFTLFWPGPEPRDRAPQRLFTCGEGGTMLVCTLGPEDYVFVGRGKKPNSAISGGE